MAGQHLTTLYFLLILLIDHIYSQTDGTPPSPTTTMEPCDSSLLGNSSISRFQAMAETSRLFVCTLPPEAVKAYREKQESSLLLSKSAKFDEDEAQSVADNVDFSISDLEDGADKLTASEDTDVKSMDEQDMISRTARDMKSKKVRLSPSSGGSVHGVSFSYSQGVFDVSSLCGSTIQLQTKDDVVFFGTGTYQGALRKCKITVKAPAETHANLFLDCLNFNLNPNGCKYENFKIKDRSTRAKTKLCESNFKERFLGSSELLIIYTRKTSYDGSCSGGFHCYIGVRGEHKKQKRASQSTMPRTTRLISFPKQDTCHEVTLGAGEMMVFASDNKRWDAQCFTKFIAPEGYVISFTCPHIRLSESGCKREFIILGEDPADKIKKKLCTNNMMGHKTQSNVLTVRYRRRELKSEECSQGFVCKVTVEPGITTPAPDPDERPFCDCGRSTVSVPNRIVSGEEASPGEYCWMVQVSNFGLQSFCGGSIITDSYVVSAAHCFFNSEDVLVDNAVAVVAGVLANALLQEMGVFVPVAQVIIHPEYNNFFLLNDIALLKLTEPIKFSNLICPICLSLPGDCTPGTNNVVAAGWGSQGCGSILSETLREVSLDLITREQCQAFHDQVQIAILESHICAADIDEGDSSYRGDSGGPLMQQLKSGRWVMCGIVSFGAVCDFGEPVVYTNASFFVPWITETIGEPTCGH
ncbi:uncharacterized protein [Panulirus ornatus]|uniref:uncharacterized protein n=1 Tax=Panulirus ornatus TaxID=150431 RepID=UPI003A8B9BE3